MKLSALAASLTVVLSTLPALVSGNSHPHGHGHGHDLSPQDFYIDGKNIPAISEYVPLEVDMYGGNIVIDKKNASRSLYFWLVEAESDDPRARDDLVIWLNGGPGCSSLVGAFGETGPFFIDVNDKNLTTVTRNPYSWHHQANVMFLEAPVGVGFTQGDSLIEDEYGFGRELFGFFENFLDIFTHYKKKRVFIVGESYGSLYSTYSINRFLKGGINVGGFGIVDGLIANENYSCEIPALPFALEHRDIMKLNDSVIKNVTETMAAVGIHSNYFDHALKYPPKGPIFAPKKFLDAQESDDTYTDVWDYIALAAYDANPCWSVYYINEPACPKKPTRWWLDPLAGFDNKTGKFGSVEYRKAMHMPLDKIWDSCSNTSVFVYGPDHDGDHSDYLSETPFFGNVIDKTIDAGGRVAIMHGGYDYRLLYNGTALAIQNTTWQGLQGMQVKPTTRLIVDGVDRGLVHTERGLTLALVDKAGHELPYTGPKSATKLLKWLLGRIEDDDLTR